MKKIYSHAAIAIVFSARTDEFLFDQYTETYRIVDWRGRINLIGGNQSPEDASPRGIWEREILEEFCFTTLSEVDGISAAPFKERALIANNMFANAKPYQDYLVNIPVITELQGTTLRHRGPIVKLNTVFETFLDEEVIECVREHLSAGRPLRNEGGSVLKHLDELSDGRTLPASATGLILENYLHPRSLHMSNPEGVKAFPIGPPRATLADYLCDFEYGIAFSSPASALES